MAETFNLGTFDTGQQIVRGLIVNDSVIDLNKASRSAAISLPPFGDMNDLLSDWDRNFELLQRIADRADFAESIPIALARPLPPLGRPRKMLYAAANYREHADGMKRTFTPNVNTPLAADQPPPPLKPYLFAKACEPTGACDDIVLPRGTERIDWEAELMVVIGRPCRSIAAADAERHIAGYLTTNDVSCRDRTWRPDRPGIRSDWLTGKSYETFAPIGPFFTPKAFVPNHADLRIRLWVNGELKQDGNTADMIFSVEEQIEFISEVLTLLPGDVIATGTPTGTGQERGEFLKSGDLVETEVDGCGRQRNRVVAEFRQEARGPLPAPTS